MNKLVNRGVITFITVIFLVICAGCSSSSNSSKNSNSKQGNNVEEKQTTNNISQSPIKLEKAVVTRHIDGDTVEVKLENGKKAKVRFIGVNTPESTNKHEPYGKEASDYTKSQLLGKTVYLEKDAGDTDKYGRLLRYVWLEVPKEINESEIKSKMFNAILASEGYAQQMTISPNVKYADYFKKFCAEARENNKGLWKINHNGTTRGDNAYHSKSKHK